MFSSFGLQLNLAEFRTSRLSFLTTLEHGLALTGRYHKGVERKQKRGTRHARS